MTSRRGSNSAGWSGGWSGQAVTLRVLAVDPGREKCGLAVVDARDGVLARGVIPTTVIGRMAETWARAHRPGVVVVGKGTALREVRKALSIIDLPMEVFPEKNTTLRARTRYFEENPPRGLKRLFRGLLTPPVPIDDYAAILIAEDYLAAARGRERGSRPAGAEE